MAQIRNWTNLIIGAIIGIEGLIVLWNADWHIALGIFLVVWGNNLQRKP